MSAGGRFNGAASYNKLARLGCSQCCAFRKFVELNVFVKIRSGIVLSLRHFENYDFHAKLMRAKKIAYEQMHRILRSKMEEPSERVEHAAEMDYKYLTYSI